jgi:hypothetical protein
MPRSLPWIVFTVLACVLLVSTQTAKAAPALQITDTPTATLPPTPTATPAYVTSYTLDSGNTLVVERRYTFGELAVFLAVVANSALYGLHWIYEVTRREAR